MYAVELFVDKKYFEISVSNVFLFIYGAMTVALHGIVYKQKHDAYQNIKICISHLQTTLVQSCYKITVSCPILLMRLVNNRTHDFGVRNRTPLTF